MEFTLNSYPHLANLIDFTELIPGKQTEIRTKPEIKITGFPVYHGKNAVGANLILFNINNKKLLFTGDILAPILRTEDYNNIIQPDIIVSDANNRFPYPNSNHWSILNDSKFIDNWKKSANSIKLISPHITHEQTDEYYKYFETFVNESDIKSIPFNIFDFCKITNPKQVYLVHYSGYEDLEHHKEEILSDTELEDWSNKMAKTENINSKFIAPRVGDKIYF